MLNRMSIFFFQAEDGIRDLTVTGVQTCALPISHAAWTAAPQRTRVGHPRHLVRLTGLQPLSRRGVDEGALSQLPGKNQRLRRFAPPGGPADPRRRQSPPPVRPLPPPSPGGRGGGAGRTRG